MKTFSGKIIVVILAAFLCVTAGMLFVACGEQNEPSRPVESGEPVKVKEGEAFELAYGTSREIAISEYITAHGNKVTAETTAEGEATVTACVDDGTLTVTAVSEGETTVKLVCGDVQVSFAVSATVGTPVFKNGGITFDYFTAKSGSYVFEKTQSDSAVFSYEYTTEQSGAVIEGETLTYTATGAVSGLVITVNVKAALQGTSVVKQTSFTVTVHVTDTTPVAKEDEIVIDGIIDLYEGEYTVDLAANIENAGNVSGYTVNGAPVSASDGKYLYAVSGLFTDEKERVTLTVAALFGSENSVVYTVELYVIDSTAYRLKGGALENDDNWSGMNGSFSNEGTYWEIYETNNDGAYYVGIDDETETVASDRFIVGNSGWITFKLGSMRPYENKTLRDIYIEVVEYSEDGEGQVLAQVRNILFADPEAALRLNDYKLDLSAYKGKTVFVRAVDNESGGNFRSLYLDAFVTWYDAEPDGDYTDLTYAYYIDGALSFDLKDTNTATFSPIVVSQGVVGTEYVFEGVVEGDGLTAEGLKLTASASGVYTVNYTVQAKGETVAHFAIIVTVTNTTVLPVLEDIEQTYKYDEWQGQTITVSLPAAEEQGRFTYAYAITAGQGAQLEDRVLKYAPSVSGTVVFTVSVTLMDKNYTVTDLPALTVTVTMNFADSDIALKDGNAIVKAFDVNDQDITDKIQYAVDFADYIIIPDGKEVSYTVTLDGKDGSLELIGGSRYSIEYEKEGLSATPKVYVFRVTASSGTASLEYTVTLEIADTYQYRLYNGGFDLGMDGWTAEATVGGLPDNAALGGISEATQYWENEPVIPQFRNDGKFFSAYVADAQEGATGTLKSSVFRIGGSGWITYKLGGAKNIEDVYMQVLSEDGSKAVTLPNFIWSDVAGQTVRGCTLVAYKANLIDYGFAEGDRVYILITDNGVSDYGLFFLDSVFTYYTEEPSEDYALASRYMIFNGGFERGNLTGWKINGDVGVVSSDSTYWNNPDKIYDKEGDFLFTWWSWDEKANEGAGAEVNRERNVGTLTSGTFALKSDAIVSFRFGGGGEKQQQIYIEFVDADTGNAVAKFYNTNASEGKLIAYQYRFALEEEIECYIRVVDNATEGWGCFALDDVRVNLASAPEGHLAATNQLLSGSME